MGQTFHPSANSISRLVLAGGVGAIAVVAVLLYQYYRADYFTRRALVVEQPIPFSHEHHVSGLGIECRYCHDTVEVSSFAGIPSTATCMSCHSQIWTNAEYLSPLRASLRSGSPIRWIRVNDVPDFVFFNHAIHIRKGVGCETCHGRVDTMPLTWRAESLQMGWCLDCHRHPERFLRPREEVYTMGYSPPVTQEVLGARLVSEYNVQTRTDCYACHR